MRNIRVASLVLCLALFATLGAFADLTTSPPGSGFGLECTLCKIERAPDPKVPEEPVKLNPIEPGLVSQWYFMSYGRSPSSSKHGQFSSKADCELARQLAYDADRCFVEKRFKYIE